MIFSVSSLLEAFSMVSEVPPGSVVGMTFGKSVRKYVATAAAMVTAVPMNAQPSRPRMFARIAPSERDRGDDGGDPRPQRALGQAQPAEQDDGEHRGAEAQGGAQGLGVAPDVAAGLQREEERAVGEDEAER